ncbi:hypothetical protein SDC9_167385 [bioreactor metagenome]|uniref:Uncharacterized protein n=1 Tax=bioreactor metagenome TaxID=1076179 RepID=A0A645G2G4_9ZZZZ
MPNVIHHADLRCGRGFAGAHAVVYLINRDFPPVGIMNINILAHAKLHRDKPYPVLGELFGGQICGSVCEYDIICH